MTKYISKDNYYQCFICGEQVHKHPYQIKALKDKRVTCSRGCWSKKITVINIEEIESKLGIADLGEWLHNKYWNEQLPTRAISELVYGNETNSPNVLGWMKHFDIPTRDRSSAVALQWVDNDKRREETSERLLENAGPGTPGRKKLIKAMQTKEYRKKASKVKLGSNNPMWNPNRSTKERERAKWHSRAMPGYKFFRQQVYERDDYTCQYCGDNNGGNLEVHHINSFSEYPKQRTDVNNGVTLCIKCHRKYHEIYSMFGANEKDFKEFMNK